MMSQSSNQLLRDLRREFQRGNVALWIGPNWTISDADLPRIAAPSWMAVWSESPDHRLAHEMVKNSVEGRIVTEVSGSVEEVLGEGYEIAGIRPFFHLGQVESDESDEFEIREQRIGKLKQLRRLRDTVLIVDGYTDSSTVNERLKTELLTAGRELRYIVILGLSSTEIEAVTSDAHVIRLPFNLIELFNEFERFEESGTREDVIQLGPVSIPLQPLLQTEPPLDQDFYILTPKDCASPPESVPTLELLDDLLTGRVVPWKAIARKEVVWDRGLKHPNDLLGAIGSVERGEARVICLDVPAEPGSGLTILLHQMAFLAASEHYPTLIHRGRVGGFDYNLVRRFLTDLYNSKEILPSRADREELLKRPAILIFDTPSVVGDALGQVDDLPEQLANDHRRVVVIRAKPVLPTSSEPHRLKTRHTDGSTEYRVLDTLRATLTADEKLRLEQWARRVLSVGPIVGLPADGSSVPLLYALYHILRKGLTSAADLGRYLLRDLDEVLKDDAGTPSAPRTEEPLRGRALLDAVTHLNRLLSSPKRKPLRPASDYRQVYLALAAFGCLGVKAPREVLTAVTGLKSEALRDVLARMTERQTAVAVTDAPDEENGGQRVAPGAYYTASETVSLRHLGFGEMVLDWLQERATPNEKQQFLSIGFGQEVLTRFKPSRDDGQIQLGLLEFILGKLNRTHTAFIEHLTTRLLRLQWREATLLDSWKKHNRDTIYQTLNRFMTARWELVSQNPSLLHTCAITAYKSCDDSKLRGPAGLPEARRRYQQAVEWIGLALEHVKTRYTSEHPGNLYVTLGLVYKAWAVREETEAKNGTNPEGIDLARVYKKEALKALRLGHQEKDNNLFAAYGLARYLIEWSQELLASDPAGNTLEVARNLTEAIVLLQIEPAEYFRGDWEELKTTAAKLLTDDTAVQMIERLKANRDELGYAIEALRMIGDGNIPTRFVSETDDAGYPNEERSRVNRAADVLAAADALSPKIPSELADLLRYSLYIARAADGGEYAERFRLLRKLVTSSLLDSPVWMYDLAMLAFQERDFKLAEETFRKLRKGRRFMDVPSDRIEFWKKAIPSKGFQPVSIRITTLNPAQSEGWGRITEPKDVTFEPVKFLVRDIVSRRGREVLKEQKILRGIIKLDRSGPIFVPGDS